MKVAFHGVISRQGISEKRISAVETPNWKSKEEKQNTTNQPTNQTNKKTHEKTQENIQRLWGNYKQYRDDTKSLSRMKRKILPKKTLLIKHSKTIHSRN